MYTSDRHSNLNFRLPQVKPHESRRLTKPDAAVWCRSSLGAHGKKLKDQLAGSAENQGDPASERWKARTPEVGLVPPHVCRNMYTHPSHVHPPRFQHRKLNVGIP